MDRRGVLVYTLLITLWAATSPPAVCCFRRHKENEILKTTSNSNDKIPKAAKDRISVRGKWMVDGYGRVRIFHGFNAVRKSFPWYADTMTDHYLKYYQEWGFNAVRLGAMWSGVNPTDGATNKTYLAIIEDMVNRAGKHGLYSLLDMHQDVISSKFASYDGVPRWVIDKMPPAKRRYPWPLKKLSQWADGYLTEAVGNAFQCLYDNVAGTRDDMARFWQTVANTFKDNLNVIGYELINEPWAGNIYNSPDLLLPGNAGQRNLAPLYDVLNTAIRKVDNTTIIFYEPVTWGMVFPGNGSQGSGFQSVPGGAAYANRSVMSWHYYCWILQFDDTKPYNIFQKAICDGLLGPKVFTTVAEDIRRVGGSSFLTEFGLCDPNNSSKEAQTVECEFVLNKADENLQSWTYWDSEFFNVTTGAAIEGVTQHFARVYASATAGTPAAMMFDLKTRQFNYTFSPDPAISAPTEIVVPPMQYPTGFTVQLSKGYVWTYDNVSHIVQIKPSKANKGAALTPVQVRILPK